MHKNKLPVKRVIGDTGDKINITAFAAEREHTVTTTSTTYKIYQIFTGTSDSTSKQLQNLKCYTNTSCKHGFIQQRKTPLPSAGGTF